uniref:Uncharacterized protein n=1 Tax=Cacopsylla melanoneura TaxID=428564 RepID=A0A8D9B3T3_9HEMI
MLTHWTYLKGIASSKIISVKHIVTIQELFGMVNFKRSPSDRRNHLQSLYVWFQNCLLLIFTLGQSFSVITRAPRYYPEVVQTFLENFIMFIFLYVVYNLNTNHKQFYSLCKIPDKFSKADEGIVQKYNLRNNQYCVGIFVVMFGALLGSVCETILPISSGELDIRRHVYRTKHPERRHPSVIRIPFIDESESWAYGIIYLLELYCLTYFTVCLSTMICLSPMAMIQLKGQYEILCKYIGMIGQEHKNSMGQTIFYHNIETHEYTIEIETPKNQTRKQNKSELAREKMKRQKIYETYYLRQVIRFHHNLLAFQDKVNIRNILSEAGDTIPS